MLQLQPQGHIVSRCPSKSSSLQGPPKPLPGIPMEEVDEAPTTVIEGEMNGMHVRDVLVDTGAARTVVHRSLVADEKLVVERAMSPFSVPMET